MEGIIVGNISNIYKIKVDKEIYTAYARGKFKNEKKTPLIGDHVEIEEINKEKKEAVIKEIYKRKNSIKRPRIANIDQIVFIISTKNPKPDLLMLDKQLAYTESMQIEPIIIINKIDLDEIYKEIQELYAKIGYTVIATSAKKGIGIDKVKEILKEKISVFSGNSGVGKSSIINALFGENKTQEGEISTKNKKGKNTTTDTKLYVLDNETYIADTPGFSNFELIEISSKEIDQNFREFSLEIQNCEFIGCSHIKEQNCGIKKAVQENKISQQRYERYCKIYEELKEKEKYRKKFDIRINNDSSNDGQLYHNSND